MTDIRIEEATIARASVCLKDRRKAGRNVSEGLHSSYRVKTKDTRDSARWTGFDSGKEKKI